MSAGERTDRDRIMHWTTSVIQVNSGIRPSVIPWCAW